MQYRRNTIRNRGLALLEVMIAVGLLTVAVASITSAIVAGQQQSMEARTTIVASIAAESLLSKLSQEPWETIDSWHGYTEDVGTIVDPIITPPIPLPSTIVDPTGMAVGGDWDLIGRQVSIAETDMFIEPLQIFIVGRTITVTIFSHDGRVLISLDRFIPEPQS